MTVPPRFCLVIPAGLALLSAFAPHARAEVDFTTQVKPLLEEKCLSCHRPDSKKGKLDISTREAALKGGSEGVCIVPGAPDDSLFYQLVMLPEDDEDLMPPSDKGGPLPGEDKEILRQWIAEGAKWPDGVILELPKKTNFARDIKPILDKLTPEEKALVKAWIAEGGAWPGENPDNAELTVKIHALIAEKSPRIAPDTMEPYAEKVPAESPVDLEMLPIPGGDFVMGSPDTEAKRKPNEGPQHKVTIAPFWMAKTEITWDAYSPFMLSKDPRNKDGSKIYPAATDNVPDLISRPTSPYQEMSFGMGKAGYPAICMTQHAANKYCEWLSAQTGHFYRLATEAEWEYACRAGTDTAYSFGNDDKELHKYAWFLDNSNFKYQKVGTKLPNPWGLHDMHGNVAEWVLDAFTPDGYPDGDADNPWIAATSLYPRAVRGGSWNDFPESLRSAARIGSTPSWKLQDPQLPKSIWYHTQPTYLGFRIVRPLEIPSADEMHAFWNTANVPPDPPKPR
jgi:formylglycine-generating enzyme required for sulfatase activity